MERHQVPVYKIKSNRVLVKTQSSPGWPLRRWPSPAVAVLAVAGLLRFWAGTRTRPSINRRRKAGPLLDAVEGDANTSPASDPDKSQPNQGTAALELALLEDGADVSAVEFLVRARRGSGGGAWWRGWPAAVQVREGADRGGHGGGVGGRARPHWGGSRGAGHGWPCRHRGGGCRLVWAEVAEE